PGLPPLRGPLRPRARRHQHAADRAAARLRRAHPAPRRAPARARQPRRPAARARWRIRPGRRQRRSMTELLRRILQVTLPLVVLGLGLAVAVALARSREEVPSVTPRAAVPLVRVVTAASTSWRARVHATGVVEPAARSDLVAEVGGRVIEVGASLADGAFFTAGETLVRLDARDHALAVVEAPARVAAAQLALAFEEAEAESARREWQAMQRPEPPPPLVVRAPQLAEARARLAAAEARLEAAEREVERCVVRAPYDGRVLDKAVDLGQFVTRGTLLAR